ncbi:MAG: FAD-dependent oxidoreductase, partial [Chloroflexota bacterium]|nr:FAD-dependent oxidoreductase [Chloroflexota bacterium]
MTAGKTAVRARQAQARTTSRREVSPAGVFVFVGLEPNTGFVRDRVATDERGCILTDAGLPTYVPGVFAAGDCRAGGTSRWR